MKGSFIENKLKQREFLLEGFSFWDLFNTWYIDRKAIYNFLKRESSNINGNNIILDFGCGEKPYEALFGGKNYVGVDVKSSGHNNEKKKVDYYYNGVNLPFENEFFDIVLSTEVFEHVPDIMAILKEINRVTKPNGKIIISVPMVMHSHEEPYDFMRYTKYGLGLLLKKSGFCVDKIEMPVSYKNTIRQLNIGRLYLKFKEKKSIKNSVEYLSCMVFNNFLFMFTNKVAINENNKLSTQLMCVARKVKYE